MVNTYNMTFGSDHHPVKNAYVSITSSNDLSEEAARTIMMALHGREWCTSYPAGEDWDSAVARYGYQCVKVITITDLAGV